MPADLSKWEDPREWRKALIVLAIGGLLLGGCWWLSQPAEPERTTVRTSTPTTTSEARRPPYCDPYDEWKKADDDRARIEQRQTSTKVLDWPESDYEDWLETLDRIGLWGPRIWPLAPSDATWASVKRACR